MNSTAETPEPAVTSTEAPASQEVTASGVVDASVQVAVTAALGRKAEELKVLEVAKVSDFTDHFMICSGTNERQVQAIADAVLHALRDHGERPLHVEGLNTGRWVLLDFGGHFVIHLFLDETRRFYDLERLWTDAPDVTELYTQDEPSAEP